MSFASNNTFGTLSSAPDGGIVEHIYNFIYVELKDFKATNNENENGITNRLCKTLEYKKPSASPYFFHHQNIEDDTENTSTDFAAFGTYAYAQEFSILDKEQKPALIKFEAKRLSTSLPKSRQKEYVIGEYEKGKKFKNSGGVERFKNGRHGKDVNKACLIGYVQTNSFTYWFKKINGWIQDEINNPSDSRLTWDNDDKLIKIESDINTCVHMSNAKRQLLNSIELRHFWIDFT